VWICGLDSAELGYFPVMVTVITGMKL